ncbi:MAG: ion transporter [Planctomycetes bacterium]|nr:ion transporter [Planctomycetota bacterium]NOG54437.1 ion transporter [Planctomycetota bacterium]
MKRRVWDIVEVAKPGDVASRTFDIAILALIFLNVIAVIIGSIHEVEQRLGGFLSVFETVSVFVFTLEYLARMWACTMDDKYSNPFSGRLRLALSPMAIVDLLAILPFYLPFIGVDLRSLRVLRLLRIVRVAKVGRYYSSLTLIRKVFRARKEELILTSAMMGLLLVVSSSLLYYCENGAQPDTFSSIPATMWWAVATLTTVGYGDIYPVTLLGKLCASVIAILGIGMFALPTGIIGAGFVEAVQKTKSEPARCPHCGKLIE